MLGWSIVEETTSSLHGNHVLASRIENSQYQAFGYELIVLVVVVAEQDGASFVPVSRHETRETGSSAGIHAVNFQNRTNRIL